MGVRYIDLRVFLDTDINEFFLVHSFEAGTLRDEIKAIGDFVLSHPTEVIIVDMNHIYKLVYSSLVSNLPGKSRDPKLKLPLCQRYIS